MTGARRGAQQGQSLVEFLAVFPVLLLLVLGVVQFSLVYVAKLTLNQAAFYGVREGTLNNASRIAMHLGIANGLAPLYQGPVWLGGQNVVTLELARAAALVDVINPLRLDISILNPSLRSYLDFGERMEDALGIPRFGIPNERLLYDTRDNGTTSLQSIQDANLLKIRVMYCHDLVVPVVRQAVGAVFDAGLIEGGLFVSQCYESGGIPLVADATMLMQTPAYQL